MRYTHNAELNTPIYPNKSQTGAGSFCTVLVFLVLKFTNLQNPKGEKESSGESSKQRTLVAVHAAIALHKMKEARAE
ncbi:hypothetical protein PBOR_20600 [Paenibacillus borealis]|uniref:Uncharacterized protein n=1 Tax=Paenibacillus borealis TaxID=160799 RepID=A0A089LG39_PAEBO|nr:hypothetical protein PBOR_20600 [Paenibacillus borealis]